MRYTLNRIRHGLLPTAALLCGLMGLMGVPSTLAAQALNAQGEAAWNYAVENYFGKQTNGKHAPKNPSGGLMLAQDGRYYSTSFGGVGSSGTVYSWVPGGSVVVHHRFQSLPVEGYGPIDGVIQASDGAFYGVTFGGGVGFSDGGTVYRLAADGSFATLHSFQGGPGDGFEPRGGLVQGADGNFYGTTVKGGLHDLGTVFRVTPSGEATVLHAFSGAPDDGSGPVAALAVGLDGDFYGTTEYGGALNLGTLFRINAQGRLKILHHFTGGFDGAHPTDPLSRTRDGRLLGLSYPGGEFGQGQLFRLSARGRNMERVHSFQFDKEGAGIGRVLDADDGHYYLASERGGARGVGTVLRISHQGKAKVLHTFQSDGDGALPRGSLVQDANGTLYGTTYTANPPPPITAEFGSLFSVSPVP